MPGQCNGRLLAAGVNKYRGSSSGLARSYLPTHTVILRDGHQRESFVLLENGFLYTSDNRETMAASIIESSAKQVKN